MRKRRRGALGLLAGVAVVGAIPVAFGHADESTSTAVKQAGAEGVTLSRQQLLINQRISQAAIRRLNELTARVDGLPPPQAQGPGGGAGRVTLSERQLLINQRISQAAVRRANALAGRLEGRLPSTEPERAGSGAVTVSAGQLLINQRIAQAAVRRANALEERIPEIPFPPPAPLSPELDDVIGVLPDAERAVMRVETIRRRGTLGDDTAVAVGDLVPVVYPSIVPSAGYGDNSQIAAIGIVSGGVMYGVHVSIIDRSELAD